MTAGTVKVRVLPLADPTVAIGFKPKTTALPEVVKPEPVRVTEAPAPPDVGLTPLKVGGVGGVGGGGLVAVMV